MSVPGHSSGSRNSEKERWWSWLFFWLAMHHVRPNCYSWSPNTFRTEYMNIWLACRPYSRHKNQPLDGMGPSFTTSWECAVCVLAAIFIYLPIYNISVCLFLISTMDIYSTFVKKKGGLTATRWMKRLKQKVAICRPAWGKVKQNKKFNDNVQPTETPLCFAGLLGSTYCHLPLNFVAKLPHNSSYKD